MHKVCEHHTPVFPQSRSPFSASLQTFCWTACAYLNTQKCGLCCSINCQMKAHVLYLRCIESLVLVGNFELKPYPEVGNFELKSYPKGWEV